MSTNETTNSSDVPEGRGVSFRHRPSIITIVTRVEPDKSNAAGNEDGHGLIPDILQEGAENFTESHEHLALYEEDMGVMQSLAGFLRSFTIPGTAEKEAQDNKQRRAKLGVVIGVFLPTIQHILGVLMFLRLYWIVGSAGVVMSFGLVFMCCLCTFLTSISMSAIATNGVVESGGSYFMISRNLGPEFGSAVGILFYLANTVATSMYLIGGVEILLTYLAPGLPQFKDPGGGHAIGQAMFNNFRIYATFLLLIEFVIVALGVKVVQLFAPITLSCVILSIISIFIGAFVANPGNSPKVCMLGNRLLQLSAIVGANNTVMCNKTLLIDHFCSNTTFTNATTNCDQYFLDNNVSYIPAVPGFASGVIYDNAWSSYMEYEEAAPGALANKHRDVYQDISTTFFVLLAIYFPSVTGIMTGSNMSGDLQDPQKSIPSGTIAAQLTTSFVYLSFVLIFGGTIQKAVLLDKYGQSLGGEMVTAMLSWPINWVLLIGSFTSTFGAALQCLCSAPRLLQSIAKDDVIPFLSVFRVVNKRGEPLRALFITTAIAECAILIGAIDYIAPIVDFFFLMCYGFVNIVCAMQTLLRSPNWRPRFHFYHWTLSLLGAALCLFIMFATYWYYALVTLALCAGIYKYVEYNGAEKEWGDGIRGLALTGARFSLLKIEEENPHTKNWRPQVLILMKLTDELLPKYRKMLTLVSQLKAGRGLVMVSSIVEGDYSDAKIREQAKKIETNLKLAMREEKVKGFAKSVICTDVSEGINVLIQSTGIGALRPNTVVVGWPYTWREEMNNQSYYDFLDAIHRIATADMCLLIPKGISNYPDVDHRLTGTIAIWWIMHDGGLLLLLPFLLKKHRVWRQCKIKVYAVATQFDNNIKMKERLNKWIYQLRIDAEVIVIELPGKDVTAYINEKTIQMEQRTKFMRELHLASKIRQNEVQGIIDEVRLETAASGAGSNGHDGNAPGQTGPATATTAFTLGVPTIGDGVKVDDNKMSINSPMSNEYTFSPAALQELKRAAEKATAASTSNDAGSSATSSVCTTAAVSPVLSSSSSPSYHVASDGTLLPGGAGFRNRADSANLTKEQQEQDDARNRKKMHTAVKLNLAIRETSGDAELVIINLPGPPKNKSGLHNYIDYLEALTEGLDKVLLVRGTGKEVITMYS